MQSKTSFFNMALFKKNISRTWIAGMIYMVNLIIMLPVLFIINTSHMGEDDWYTQMGYTMEMRLYEYMSGSLTTFYGIFMALVVTAITFWYLFNRRDSYMMHSFPVSRKSMYFTGLLSSLVINVVPVIVASIGMTLAAIVRGAHGLSCIWYWALIEIVSTCLFTGIALFSLMITGQLITGCIFYFIFNYLYLMMEVAFRLTASILVYGLSDAMSGINYKIWSPVEFIPEKVKVNTDVVMDENYTRVIDFSHELIGGKYIAIYAIAAVVLFIISYQIYHYKKLETVLDFIAVPFMKPVFSVGMSFFISMVAGAFVAGMVEAVKALTYDARYTIAIVSALIIGAIIYFATQMLIEKTLRVFCMKNAIHCMIYSVAAFAVLLCFRLDVFGIENRVPQAKDIIWAGIQIDETMVFTDDSDIENLRQLHQNFLTDKVELRNLNYKYREVDGGQFTIRYKLKNGDIVIRNYPVVNTESEVVSSEYVAAAQPILDFVNNPGRIKEHIIGSIWNDCEIKQMDFDVIKKTANDYEYDNRSFDNLTTKEKREKFSRIYEAFLKDVDAGKLYQQNFAGYDYTERKGLKNNIFNALYFTIENKEKGFLNDGDVFWDNPIPQTLMHQQDIYPTLNKDCVNTLKALKDEGFYDDDSDIYTNYEFRKKFGELEQDAIYADVDGDLAPGD